MQRLRQQFPRLSPAQQVVAGYILENPSEAMQASVQAVAAACGTSVSTVVRLAKDIGFEGLKEMKLALALEIGTLIPDLTTREAPGHGDSSELLENTLLGLKETAAALDLAKVRQVAALLAAARHVDVYGASTSHLVGLDLVEKLKRLGIYASSYENSYMQAISSAGLGEQDVAVAITYSGETRSVVECLASAREQGARTVALTNFLDSSVVEFAEVVLATSVSRHLIPDGSLGGRIAQLHVVDTLFVEIIASDPNRFRSAFHRYNQILLQKVGKSRDRLGLGEEAMRWERTESARPPARERLGKTDRKHPTQGKKGKEKADEQ